MGVSGGETQRGQASLFWLRSLIDSRFGYDAGEITMPRPSRADEAGGLDHALNRGNLRAEILHNSLALASIARTRAEAAFTMAPTAIAELRGSRQRTAHRRSSWSLSGNVFRVAVRESDLCPKNKSKRPDPFDARSPARSSCRRRATRRGAWYRDPSHPCPAPADGCA